MRRVCILFLFALLPSLVAATDPPSVILITVDTVRADRMGFLGSTGGLTPRLDDLAKQAVIFEQSYAQAPYDPTAPFKERFANAPYDACVAYVDATVGKLLAGLRGAEIYDSALIAVTSDHGESLGEHGENTHGVFLYDSTIRVPLLIKFPQAEFARQRVSSRVSLVDIAPTLLSVTQAPVP